MPPNAHKQFFMGVNADKDALFPQLDSQTNWPPRSAMPHGMLKSSMEMRFDEVVGGSGGPVLAAGGGDGGGAGSVGEGGEGFGGGMKP
jgi:hypothetical protein